MKEKAGKKNLDSLTGRYSHALAQTGHPVDAVELLEHNIEGFQRNTLPGERVTVRQGNALDLGDFGNDSYDLTLLLGPCIRRRSRKGRWPRPSG